MILMVGCSVDGCSKPHKSRGWCNAHYLRWLKHGDPLGGGTSHGEPERYFREVVMAYEGDECISWPYATSTNGYGLIWLNDRVRSVSVLVCEKVHGSQPTPEHEAAHSCGKGMNACVTKGHLSWKTPIENAADKVIHGTVAIGELNGQAKITEDEAREILTLKGSATQREIATLFGITRSNVGSIHRRESWGWLGPMTSNHSDKTQAE